MSVERSERGVLTTNADYTDYSNFYIYRVINSGQWSIENNSMLSYSGYFDPRTMGNNESFRFNEVIWNGTDVNNNELEYAIISREYNSGNPYDVTETEFVSSGTPLQVYSMWQNKNSEPWSFFAYKIFVRRKDGGVLTPSSMEGSIINMYAFTRVTVTTAIPQNWLETTTQSIPTYTTQTTMLTTVDYEGYLSTLTIPVDVRPAIATLDQLINDLWSLHYIPFVVCFALIMGLAIWLLH